MSIQIEIKKKIGKPRKQVNKVIPVSLNNKKNIKIFTSN